MGADEYAVREAEPEDWSGIAALLGRAPAAGQELRQQVQEQLESPVALVALAPPTPLAPADASGAPLSGQLVGASVAGLPPAGAATGPATERAGRVLWLGVAPGHRRRGLGTRLLGEALDELRRRGARQASLVVDGTQVEALALFRKLGFQVDGQDLGLLLPPEKTAALATQAGPATGAQPAASHQGYRVGPLHLDHVPLLSGLLIHLGVERAQAPHDTLDAFTPAQVEAWLQRPATAAGAAWDADDAQTPLGLAWASRRAEDGLLRYIGVHDDHRRRGIGTALLAALAQALGATRAGAPRALRTDLTDPGAEAEFFRTRGFEAERISHRMSLPL